MAEKKLSKYNAFEEYGKIGQKRYNGQFFEEFEPRLKGLRAVEVYNEMSTDETIGAILFCIEMLIKNTDFYVEPGGNSEADRKCADFIEECINDLNPGWSQTLNEILSFLTYGWSVHEICYKRRNGASKDECQSSKYSDGLIGWSKFAIRAQDTLAGWVYDEHEHLVAFEQNVPYEIGERTIPFHKILHFKTQSKKENPEGRSILRNCYKAYHFKSQIQIIEGIGIERDLAGLPLLYAPENSNIYSDDEESKLALNWAQSVISSLRRDEVEGVVLPEGWKIELLTSGGARQFNTGDVIDRYDKRIAMTVMADFLMLGHDGSGSYALSKDKTSTFFLAINSFLNIITETINNQAIPRLIDLNGDKFKGITDYPKLQHDNIAERDLEELAKYVQTLVQIGAITPDSELEKFLRQEGDLPMYMDIEEYDDYEPDNVKPEENTDELTEVEPSDSS